MTAHVGLTQTSVAVFILMKEYVVHLFVSGGQWRWMAQMNALYEVMGQCSLLGSIYWLFCSYHEIC